MAKQGQTTHQGLEGLTAAVRNAANAGPAKGLPPVHLWNPPFCGDLDMRIASDGTWFYMGTPIGRPALVRLFSTILKREDGKHFLVTPVEKVGIRVDDAPFLAVEMLKETDDRGRLLRFRTNVDDWVPCDSGHRLRFEAAADGGLTPYLHVRADLWARSRGRFIMIWLTWARSEWSMVVQCSGSRRPANSLRWRMRSR